jgi:HAMP domain-containing protein
MPAPRRRAERAEAAQAVLALGALLFGLSFILKRDLVNPLRKISQAVDRVRSGERSGTS